MDDGRITAGHEEQRQRMVERHLRPRGIRDERVLEAMCAVPRHRFVPEYLSDSSYEDCAWPVTNGEAIGKPYLIARLCELAEVQAHQRALVVGAGAAFQAAVVARSCKEVVSVEPTEAGSVRARQALAEFGIRNVTVVTGDASLGHALAAPYDTIVVAGAVSEVPAELLAQLAVDGRLVIPLGTDYLQKLTVLHKTSRGFEQRSYGSCEYAALLSQTHAHRVGASFDHDDERHRCIDIGTNQDV